MWTLGIDVEKRRHRTTAAHDARRPAAARNDPSSRLAGRIRISRPAWGIVAALLLACSAPLSADTGEAWRGPHPLALEARALVEIERWTDERP